MVEKMANLLSLFSSLGVLKILNFLVLYHNYDYTKTDIIENSGISRKTLYEVWPILEDFELITPTRKVGNAQLFKLNMENEINKKLVELYKAIILFKGEKIAVEELQKEIEVSTKK